METTAHTRRSWFALAAIAFAMLTIGLDTTVLIVALPTLSGDLHASNAQLQWFSTAYTLVLAALLLPAGALGDRLGRKRVLLAALVVFGAASAWCAFAPDAGNLIAARAVLGVGAAAMMPLSMAVLPILFPEPAARTRAMTIWITAMGLGMPLGPIIGGWLLEHFWWGSVFLINVPMIIAGIIAVALLVPESRSDEPRPIDLLGVLLSSGGLAALTYGFIQLGNKSWTNATGLSAVAGAVVLLAVFIAWQRRAAHPLIDLTLFRNRSFTGGVTLATVVNFALFGVMFTLPLLYQSVQGHSALETGLRLLPMIGGMVVATRIVEKLIERTSAGIATGIGYGLVTIGLVVGTFTDAGTSYGVIATWLAVIGFGFGITMPTTMNVAMNALDVQKAGVGSGLIQAMRQAGGTIGVAICGSVMIAGYRADLGQYRRPPITDGVGPGMAVAHRSGSGDMIHTVQTAFAHGMSSMLWVCAAVCLLAAVGGPLMLRRPARPDDEPVTLSAADPDADIDESESVHVRN
ncbi:MFS transporter [Jongsikchunia kroppenstedtii]|uniref:MFS transporter n=1 Tax=Jongsikchunia kroppenstedtii TaxID=1121721 RepID=UPI00035D54DD|nr:MFS transporter [Jongsikchunia kroppenstedtii]